MLYFCNGFTPSFDRLAPKAPLGACAGVCAGLGAVCAPVRQKWPGAAPVPSLVTTSTTACTVAISSAVYPERSWAAIAQASVGKCGGRGTYERPKPREAAKTTGRAPTTATSFIPLRAITTVLPWDFEWIGTHTRQVAWTRGHVPHKHLGESHQLENLPCH